MRVGAPPGPGQTEALAPPDPLLDRPPWAPDWVPDVDDVRRVRWLRWAVAAVLAAGVLAFIGRGGGQPADPALGEPVSSASLAEAFGTIVARIVTGAGEAIELCLLHADQAAERTQGLRGVVDLQGHDGMLFTNETAVERPYHMHGTVLPLTVSWWREDGSFLAGTDAEVCMETDPAECRRYEAGGPYRWAIEVPRGALSGRGIREGSRLEIGAEGCPAAAPPGGPPG